MENNYFSFQKAIYPSLPYSRDFCPCAADPMLWNSRTFLPKREGWVIFYHGYSLEFPPTDKTGLIHTKIKMFLIDVSIKNTRLFYF